MPFVDRGVVLDARIGAGPGRVGDLVPQFGGIDGFGDLAVGTADQVPVLALGNSFQEVIADPDGVVRVLTGDGEVGFAVPVGVVGREVDFGEALLGELDDPLDVVLRDHRLAAANDGFLQGTVLLRVEAGGTLDAVGLAAGGHDFFQMLLGQLGAGDQGRDLLLFPDLPVDVFLDVRMVDVDGDHLRRTAGGAAGLDRAGSPVADLQKAHQAGGLAATGQGLALAAQAGEVGAGAGAIFEEPRFTDPEVHDAAVIHQIVADALDEAGMGLGMLVCRLGAGQLAGLVVDIMVALCGTVDAISPVQAGIEPLGGVRGSHLPAKHMAHFFVIGLGIGFGVEVAAFPAPVCPGAGQPVENLLGAAFADRALIFRKGRDGVLVRGHAPQP